MLGPAGPFYTRSDVVGNRLEYPAEAPALAAGVRYTVRVVAGSQPAQEAWFEVLVPARAESLRPDLGAMDQSLEGRRSFSWKAAGPPRPPPPRAERAAGRRPGRWPKRACYPMPP
jgi:hypothetical protein